MTSSTTMLPPPRETKHPKQPIRYELDPPPATNARSVLPARLSWDQLLLGQLPFVAAVALIVGIVAFATVQTLPAGASLPGRQDSSQAAATDGTITRFSAGTAAQQVAVATDPSGAPRWGKASYEARAGDVTFVVANGSPVAHNFAIEGPGIKVQSPTFAGKSTNSFTVKGLPPGEYLIVCTFAGHREGGMIAKLTVT